MMTCIGPVDVPAGTSTTKVLSLPDFTVATTVDAEPNLTMLFVSIELKRIPSMVTSVPTGPEEGEKPVTKCVKLPPELIAHERHLLLFEVVGSPVRFDSTQILKLPAEVGKSAKIPVEEFEVFRLYETVPPADKVAGRLKVKFC